MKKYITLVTLTLFTTAAISQSGEDRDYGELLPEKHFQIKNSKTSLKDNADISNYKIIVTPKKDEFTYKVNSVRTPRGGVMMKKKDFKLEVEREDGKITRFSSVGFSSEEGGVHNVQSTSLHTSGFIKSHTNCYEDYKFGLFGIKKQRGGFKCVTVSAPICEYLKKNQIDSVFVEKINACSNVLNKLSAHQKSLHDMSKDEHANDMSALAKINGKLSGARNFYDLESSTLKDVSEIILGYESVLDRCDSLEKKGLLAPSPTPVLESQESKSSANAQ
jgi:hypothetical protein